MFLLLFSSVFVRCNGSYYTLHEYNDFIVVFSRSLRGKQTNTVLDLYHLVLQQDR